MLAQSYQRIEWIVVEDGGRCFASFCTNLELPQLMSVRHIEAPKLGRSNAANLALDAAQGEFVGFLDDDDLLYSQHVETLVALLLGHPNSVGAYAASRETFVGESGTVKKERTFFRPCVDGSALIFTNLFPIQAVAFRSRILERHRFDNNLDALEDWLFWLQLFLGRSLVWTTAVTSQFFVPDDQSSHARARIAQHEDASGYFSLQRDALLAERGAVKVEELRQKYVAFSNAFDQLAAFESGSPDRFLDLLLDYDALV